MKALATIIALMLAQAQPLDGGLLVDPNLSPEATNAIWAGLLDGGTYPVSAAQGCRAVALSDGGTDFCDPSGPDLGMGWWLSGRRLYAMGVERTEQQNQMAQLEAELSSSSPFVWGLCIGFAAATAGGAYLYLKTR